MGRWILATVGGLVSLTVVLIGVLSVGGIDTNEQELIRTFLSAVIPLATATLALMKVSEWDTKLKNGYVEKKAVEALGDPDSHLTKAVKAHTKEGGTDG